MSEVITVRGPISPNELGITLMHEHVFTDLRSRLVKTKEKSKRALQKIPVSLKIFSALHRDLFINEDNLVLDNIDLAVSEVSKYKMRGGGSLVDMTIPGIGRNPLALRAVSEAANIHIICGTGWYQHTVHPPIIRKKTTRELTEIMVHELEDGIGDTGIRAGVIGEIGLSYPIHIDEKKVLQAAVEAQRETRAAINIHPPLFDYRKKITIKEGNNVVNMIEKFGADLGKTVLAHLDNILDIDYQRSLLNRGVVLEYDMFGNEHYIDSIGMGIQGVSDKQRVNALAELCDQGYEKQLLMSHDICFKIMLTEYGGLGYAHILEHIVPTLKTMGVSNKQVNTMTIENPKRILPF